MQTWSNLGALVTSESTYTSIKAALDAHRWPAGMRYEVYLQGSYRNWTNTRGDSDVDVVAELTSTVNFDTSALLPGEAAAAARTYTPVANTFEEFRDEVQSALDERYGYFNVHNEEKCFHVDKAPGRLGADVVACNSLHKYHPGQPRTDGIMFRTRPQTLTDDVVAIENFPKLHFANGASKNAATREYFKPMARIFKNARTAINDERVWTLRAPSYFVECMLYNVRDAMFGTSYQDTYKRAVLSLVLPTAVGATFSCQNEQLALFGDRREQWDRQEAIALVQAMGELWESGARMTAFSLDSDHRRVVVLVAGAMGLVVGYAIAVACKAAAVEMPWWLNVPGPLAAAGFAYVIFERWVWRLRPFLSLFGVPDLNGTWAAELRSSYDDHQLVHRGTAKIVQTWSRIVIDFETVNSRSRSTCAAMFLQRGTMVELEYGYKNTPKSDAKESMQASTGFAVLQVEAANVLDGEYFTGRGRERHGNLRLTRSSA